MSDIVGESDYTKDELEEAYEEGRIEGIAEGRCEANGAAGAVFRFMYGWLKRRGLCFDDGEGINVHDVEEGLRLYASAPTIRERERAERAEAELRALRKRVAAGFLPDQVLAAAREIGDPGNAALYRGPDPRRVHIR